MPQSCQVRSAWSEVARIAISEPSRNHSAAGGGYLVVVRWVAAVLMVSALLAGCSDDEPDAAPDDGSADHTSMSIADHCAHVQRTDADATVTPLTGDGMTLPAADFVADEPNGTVLVLLHQTGRLGLCGWATFAPQAAAAGLSSVAIDMCGYASAECDGGQATPAEDQVALAVAHAREELGAETVVLVGASMGGSQTVVAVAHGADVDGWVDVSGPAVWEGTTLLDLAPDVRARGLPGLVAHAPDDDAQQYAAARALAPATGAQFLDGQSDHGWLLLDDHQGTLRPDGQAVIDFVNAIQDG
jgi:pimeloyl-ACP methyl ester carboxylesterase